MNLLLSALQLPLLHWTWEPWDTSIVILGAVAAMSCTLPGIWLVLRQQSMMGDALSHTALPGVVIGFLAANWAVTAGLVSPERMLGLESLILATMAVLVGVLTALLTETIQRVGRIESSAALGVVFTSLFALGLFLIRLTADSVHIDPECVLFGQLELAIWDTAQIGGWEVPKAVISNLGILLINGALMTLFYKELKISAFDPELATSLGIDSRIVNYCLMAVTAVTMVMAFTSVGSILVVAILIVPAACGFLASDRLPRMIAISLMVAAASAVLGHVMAKTVPGILGQMLGQSQIQDASTPGMIAVACGLFFTLAYLLSPRHSVLVRALAQYNMARQMAEEDVVANLYRLEEASPNQGFTTEEVRESTNWISAKVCRKTLKRVQQKGLITNAPALNLTELGRQRAAEIVRGHRLWESFLHQNFQIDSSRVHESADRVEHVLTDELRTQLNEELNNPLHDPHGKAIPPNS